MSTPVYNPYKLADAQFTDGLDFIAINLPANPTFDDLITAILAYFSSLPDPVGPDGLGVMQSLMPNTANDYIHSKIAQNLNFNQPETDFIQAVLSGIREESIESMGDFLEAAVEQLAQSDINTVSKTSIYAALSIAKANQAYWKNNMTTPGSWTPYIDSNAAINYANIPHWTIASILGAFSGFAQVQAPNIGNADVWNTQGRLQSVQNSLATALALTAGKVIFKWAKRPVV